MEEKVSGENENKNKFVLSGMYIEPSIISLDKYYKEHINYSKNHLVKGLKLWNMNIIKRQVIPQSKIDKKEFYRLNCKNTDDWTSDDFKLANDTQKHFESMMRKPFPVTDTDTLLMAIATESVLKGFLLYNGYIIHNHKKSNKLIKIKDYNGDYSEFVNDIYGLGEFLKFHVLEAALTWESHSKLLVISRDLKHLKKVRDREAHLAVNMHIFQIYDMLLYKTVHDIMAKAEKILK